MSKDNEPYLDGIRIGGQRQEVAQQAIELSHKLMAVACGEMEEAPAEIALMAGFAMVPLGSISKHLGQQSNREFQPTMDEIRFGAYYVISALQRHPNGVVAGFGLEFINDALRLFKDAMGRDYDGLCEPIKEALGEWRKASKNVPDSVKQFLPE